MKTLFTVFQFVFSLGLVVLVLLQSKGSILGKTLGESTSYHSKKGIEKIVSVLTVICAVMFLTSSLINAFLL